MARKLPWKRAEAEPDLPAIKTESPRNAKRKSPSSFSTPSRPKRVALSHSALSNRARSPSTSPPPEPPKEQFMTTTDDKFRIVEDEFLHTAQKFTAHLHRAEYQRLKTLAASQNAETIRAIERPVVGPQSRTTKQRAEVARKTARQQTLLTDSNDDPPRLATGLRGLMESPRKQVRSIRTLGKATTATRAAAGFGSSPSRPAEEASFSRSTEMSATTAPRDVTRSPSRRPRETPVRNPRAEETDSYSDIDTPEECSDDDLGSAPTSQRLSSKRQENINGSTTRTTSSASTSAKTVNRAKSAPNLKQTARLDPTGTTTETVPTKLGDDEDDDDPFGIRTVRIRRTKSRDQMRKPAPKESVDLIPSFL